MQDDCALRVSRNGFDRRVVLVIGVQVLVVENGVCPTEELRRGTDPRIKDHRRNVRGDGCICIGGGVVHIRGDTRGATAADFVEEDAVDGDVGWSVVGPIGVDADIIGEGGVGGLGEARVDVAERLDVCVAVELGNAVYVDLFGRVAGCGECTRAAVAVDDHLPVHTREVLYGVEDGGPCGAGRVDIEWKEDEERGCGKDEDGDGKEI